jgi:predicted DNA-binding transcriptional regulator AlpA
MEKTINPSKEKTIDGEKTIYLDGENRLLSISEACSILEIKKLTLYLLMQKGLLPYYDLPKRKIGTKDLAEYIESLRRTGGEKTS